MNSHLVSERDAFVIDNTEASTFPPQQFFYEWQHRDDVQALRFDAPTYSCTSFDSARTLFLQLYCSAERVEARP